MKRISTYILIGLELIGLWLLSQHRYMGFRTEIFIFMIILAIVYIVCEFIHIMYYNFCVTDIICDTVDSEDDCEEIKDKLDNE